MMRDLKGNPGHLEEVAVARKKALELDLFGADADKLVEVLHGEEEEGIMTELHGGEILVLVHLVCGQRKSDNLFQTTSMTAKL